MRWLRVVWALSGAWLLFAAATVSAQPSDATARGYFEAGAGYFESGNYAAAVREFERAYELSSHPPALYYLYAAHERLGHDAEAADYLAKYLRSGDVVENRDALEGQLADLQHRLEPAPVPASEPVPEPSAAEPRPSATKAPNAPTLTQPADGPSEVSERFMLSLGMFAAAGGGAVTFAVGGALALKEDRAVSRSCGRDADRTCSDDDLSGLRRRMTVADIGLGVLVVGGLVGTTLLWLDRRDRSRRAAALRPVASFSAHGGQLALGGRF